MIITYHDWFCQWLVARGRCQSMLRTNDDLLPSESKRKGIYFSVRNMYILDHEYSSGLDLSNIMEHPTTKCHDISTHNLFFSQNGTTDCLVLNGTMPCIVLVVF